MPISLLQIAEIELRESVDFYELESPGLGQDFLKEVLLAFDRIQQFPLAWQTSSRQTRSCPTKRFPYKIIYRQHKGNILIVPIAHMHRKPDYWKSRINRITHS